MKKEKELSLLFEILENAADVKLAWKEIIERLPALNSVIEVQHCQTLFESLSLYLGPQESTTSTTASLYQSDFVDNFSFLVYRVPKFASYVDQIRPEVFREKINIIGFLSSENIQLRYSTLVLMNNLYQNCECFKSYVDYVTDEPFKYSKQILVLEKHLNLKGNQPNTSTSSRFQEVPGLITNPSDFIYDDPNAAEKLADLIYGNADEDEISTDRNKVRNTNLVNLLRQEEEIVRNINANKTLLDGALQDKNREDEVEKLSLKIRELTKDLKNVHEERRRKKKKVFEVKKEYYIKKKGETKELKDLCFDREKCLAICEQIYDIIANQSTAIDVTETLCLLDSQISSLYEMNIAIAFCGLLKAGKSSTLNSFIGFDISPNRVTPMTSIPIRYVHTEEAVEPVMIIPFYTPLNGVIRRIKQIHKDMVKSKDHKEEEVKEFITTQVVHNHLLSLLDECVNDKLKLHRKYVGLEQIREICAKVHDLFRLASLDIFSSASELLPSQWARGLDFLLTVYCRFEAIRGHGKDLVTLSLVDTPGIDEAGVEALKLSKMLQDTILNCQLAAMVSTPYNFSSNESAKVLEYINELKSKNTLDVMVIVNKADLILDDEKIQLQNEVQQKSGIPKRNVHLVSALNYLTCLSIKENVNKLFTQSGGFLMPKESSPLYPLIQTYLRAVNKKENDVLKITKDELLEELEDLKEYSNISKLQKFVMNASFTKGMMLSISNTAIKVLENSSSVTESLKIESKSVSATQLELNASIEKVTKLIESFEKLKQDFLTEKLKNESLTLKSILKNTKNDLFQEVNTLKLVTTIANCPHVCRVYLESLNSQLQIQIFTSAKGARFDNKKEVEEAIKVMSEKLIKVAEAQFVKNLKETANFNESTLRFFVIYLEKLSGEIMKASKELNTEFSLTANEKPTSLLGSINIEKLTEEASRSMVLVPNFEEKQLGSLKKGLFGLGQGWLKFLFFSLFDHVVVDHVKTREYIVGQAFEHFSDAYLNSITVSISKNMTSKISSISDSKINRLKEIRNNLVNTLKEKSNDVKSQERRMKIDNATNSLGQLSKELSDFLSVYTTTKRAQNLDFEEDDAN